MDPIQIGQFIRNLRTTNHLTQKQFAAKLGVTYQAVSKWETGKNMPDILTLKEISRLFNIELDELLTGQKKNTPQHVSTRQTTFKFFILGLIILSIIIAFGLVLISKQHSSNFEFKTMTSSCDEFTLNGSAAYNQDKTSIYISDVDYCGTPNDTIYQQIECSLYESYQDTKTKIGTCGQTTSPMTLEEFLDTVQINVNNYVASCKMFTNSSLSLEIDTINQQGQQLTYHIPIKLEDNCQK